MAKTKSRGLIIKADRDQANAIHAAKGAGLQFDESLAWDVLTDKDEGKALPCRKCSRACIVNAFAAPAKTECTTCREGTESPEKVHEFDESKEEHVLTDKDETKRLPCRNCGRPCIVNQFAAPAKVACKECRKYVPTPRRTTKLEKDADGRYREEVVIDSPGDLQWSQWTIASPIDIERLFLEEEAAEHAARRDAAVEAGQNAATARRQRQDREARLKDQPVRVTRKKNEKPAEHQRREADLEAETKALEAEITALDGVQVEQEDVKRLEQERQTELARIAWIRGALALRYRVKKDGNHHVLVRAETSVVIPDDFLDEAGYKQAQQKAPAPEAVAA